MYDLTQVNITTTKKRRKNGFGDKPLNTSKKLLPQLEKKKKKKMVLGTNHSKIQRNFSPNYLGMQP